MKGNPFLSCHGCSYTAGWYRSRCAMPMHWVVAEWVPWGHPLWLTDIYNYYAVVDDFGELVRVHV